jgi:hypothetical protein
MDWGGGQLFPEENSSGEWVKHEDVKELIEALKKAQWLHRHILGKEKRVDWGKTFDVNWIGVNDALLSIDKAILKAGAL